MVGGLGGGGVAMGLNGAYVARGWAGGRRGRGGGAAVWGGGGVPGLVPIGGCACDRREYSLRLRCGPDPPPRHAHIRSALHAAEGVTINRHRAGSALRAHRSVVDDRHGC